jgi:hypothetical protein
VIFDDFYVVEPGEDTRDYSKLNLEFPCYSCPEYGICQKQRCIKVENFLAQDGLPEYLFNNREKLQGDEFDELPENY